MRPIVVLALAGAVISPDKPAFLAPEAYDAKNDPMIDTGGAPTVTIINGAGSKPAEQKPVRDAKGVTQNLTNSVLKGAKSAQSDSNESQSRNELIQLETEQKSQNESVQTAQATEREAAKLEEAAKLDKQAVNQEENRHGQVMETLEAQADNAESAFLNEEQLEKRKLYRDEQKLAHDEEQLKVGAQAIGDEARLNADKINTEKALEQEELQSTRRKYATQEKAVELAGEEAESGHKVKRAVARARGAEQAEEHPDCHQHQPQPPPLLMPVQEMPC